MLDKCERGNKIAPLQHKCQAKTGGLLKGCNFIAPQALIQQLYYYYFILLLNYRAIFVTCAERSEAHMLKRCIKNCSIVKLYNKVLIITNGCKSGCYIWRNFRIFAKAENRMRNFFSWKIRCEISLFKMPIKWGFLP